MCNTQTTKGVELQGNGNAVANVKNVEIKHEFLELQEFVIGWYGSTKTAAKKLQNLYFQFINVQLEADGCVLQSFLDELYFIQSMIEILGKEDNETQDDTEQDNKQIKDLREENKVLKEQLKRQTEQINILIELNKKK